MAVLEWVISVDGVPIRLTDERWAHITESHDYMAGHLELVLETIGSPDKIAKGTHSAHIAVKKFDHTPLGRKYVTVVYRQGVKDGYVITAFMTSKPGKIFKKGVIWSRQEN
ncbi:MAG: hypothetical protein HYU99_05695 [Deltaproteobacteria bacterium]|nr:hypothetical protein [Deltaproteobacteria bacterium]